MTDRWHVILTRPGLDAIVAQHLDRCLGDVTYRPTLPPSRRRRREGNSMFPGYVFAVLRSPGLWRVAEHYGARGLYVASGRIVTGPQCIIDAIRATELAERNKQANARKEILDLPPGTERIVQHGPLMGLLAVIAGHDARGRVEVLVHILGALTPVTLPVEHLTLG